MRWLALPAHVTMKTLFYGFELAAGSKYFWMIVLICHSRLRGNDRFKKY